MHASVVHAFIQPPRFEQFPEPVAAAGEILVTMLAAGLHPVVKSRASGQHYSSASDLPVIAGIDGVGTLPNGRPVYCFATRSPYGTMAERMPAREASCIPLPEGLDPVLIAAIVNPGMSAWLSLKVRAALQPGESVLILGATGVAGQLAVQAARLLGARRIVAAGRNPEVLHALNANAVIPLEAPEDAIREAYQRELAQGIDVVIDFLWGRPTELLLEAMAKDFRFDTVRRTRLIEVGESAGKAITLPGATLRSVDLTLCGSGLGSVPVGQIMAAIPELFSMAAAGTLEVDVERVPLEQVEQAWNRVEKGRRIVFTI